MRVLVTAGTVYGRLDDNKLVGNRVRGIWAARFAGWLAARDHDVTLLVADIQKRSLEQETFPPLRHDASIGEIVERSRMVECLTIKTHNGFFDYHQQCLELAPQVDAAVMAAAVVNWIPKHPFEGKMPTVGVGHEMMIPFFLAPRVIDGMKARNRRMTLIACKMTIGSSHDDLIELGYKTLLGSRANAVIANDQKQLKDKYVIHQDRVVLPFKVGNDFFAHLLSLMEDEHFTTKFEELLPASDPPTPELLQRFDALVDKYRNRFTKRVGDQDFVFGSLALPYRSEPAPYDWSMLISPREKGLQFTSADATTVRTCRVGCRGVGFNHEIVVTGPRKASLNAPLMLYHLGRFHRSDGSGIHGVIHLHEQLPGAPTLPYAPPGTLRDYLREVPGPVYNIEGHGCIAGLDRNGEIVNE